MNTDQKILDIARRNLLVRQAGQRAFDSNNQEFIVPDDLSTQNMDRFDFYEVSVSSVRAGLEEAYEAGVQSASDAISAKLQREIMNLPCNVDSFMGAVQLSDFAQLGPTVLAHLNNLMRQTYKMGHRDARHGAIEKVLEATV